MTTSVPILDPEAVPVVGDDAHLPAVDPARLLPEALRRRFAEPPVWQPEVPGDGRVCEREPARASVLVPLVMHRDALSVLLTRRTGHLRSHAGQVSFPGGRAEEHDADAVETALRETEEEVGLAREQVEVIGSLPAYTTITAFHVTPVVALVRSPLTLALDAFEVAEAFEVPLQFLMTPANHHRHRFEALGSARQFLSMPWEALDAGGQRRRYFIWGATAAMLRNFYRFLSA
jgi:8-oxo-dGTP pyrophosphatase MutT (NUDIX family)